MPELNELPLLRRHFAQEVLLNAGLLDPALQGAFARVPRELFFGPGPWQVAVMGFPNPASYRYLETSDDHPTQLYHNVALALDASQSLVTALPSSVALCLHALALQAGERVLHLGAGVGYYTAVMAELVGATGRVWATEVHTVLGARAQQALKPWAQVQLEVRADLPAAESELDALFINTGVTHVAPDWLDRMAVGGRLLLPLTTALDAHVSVGLWMHITREAEGWTARPTTPAVGYSAVGLRNPGMEAVLRHAMASGRITQVQRLRRDAHAPEASCVLHHPGACLSC